MREIACARTLWMLGVPQAHSTGLKAAMQGGWLRTRPQQASLQPNKRSEMRAINLRLTTNIPEAASTACVMDASAIRVNARADMMAMVALSCLILSAAVNGL